MTRLVRGAFLVALAVAGLCSGPAAAAGAAAGEEAWVEATLAQSRCADMVVVTWVPDLHVDGRKVDGHALGVSDGSCVVLLDAALQGTPRGCDVRVHEELHLAGVAHAERGVMAEWTEPYPPCYRVGSRRQRAIAAVRDLLPRRGATRAWRITCNVGTTRCRASAPGVRAARRYSVALVGDVITIAEIDSRLRRTSRARHACSACRARRQQRFPTTSGARCG